MPPSACSEARLEDAVLAEHDEAVGVVTGEAVVLRGDDVVGDVDAALDGHHEMIFRVADLVGIPEKRLLRQGAESAEDVEVAAQVGKHLIELAGRPLLTPQFTCVRNQKGSR